MSEQAMQYMRLAAAYGHGDLDVIGFWYILSPSDRAATNSAVAESERRRRDKAKGLSS